ncbi:HAD-IIIA family hydrolase [Thermocrinis sp.]|uniref:KdsC family phosphatase n=1 Tax=Thermocrinis sp. TaxID=2024383 RepID=UPI002FDDE743
MKIKKLSGILESLKLLLLDVDGVLTDGKLYYTENGEEIKVFDVRDGLGIKLLQKAGIEVGVISGRSSKALIRRLEELDISEVHIGRNDKLKVLEQILQKKGLEPREIGFVGDDYMDIPVLKVVGFPATVKDAPRLVKRYAIYVSKKRGGEGAVREIAELILRTKGKLKKVLEDFT